MTKLESLKKLRDFLKGTQLWRSVDFSSVDFRLDTIEREIAERYMELPLDADGVPWLLTDEKFIDTTGEVCEINALSFSKYHAKWKITGNNCYVYSADECHHIKPDPVKELLEEFAEIGIRIGASEPIPANLHMYPDEEVIDEFVKRIRQAVES